jgi:TRAP-type transport system periplasmic protein
MRIPGCQVFMEVSALRKMLAILTLLCIVMPCINLTALTIKLGSLAPADTPWDKQLRKIASDWEKASNGRVSVKIYTGGIVGDEVEMIRKIRLGQLHAAAITGVGMNQIYKGVLAFSVPLLIRTDDELSYVLEKAAPFFEAEMAKKSFTVVTWTTAGWAHIFAKQPVRSPSDLKKQKFWVWEGNSKELQIWQEAGFPAVPLGVPDIMTGLQSGMIDALISTPLSAGSYQWFAIAKNMSEMNWGPMVAGIVVYTSVWNKIPKDLQAKFLEIAHKAGPLIAEETKKADAEAITVMKKYGLNLVPQTKQGEIEWKNIVDKYFMQYINSEVGIDSYNLVNNILKQYRSNAKNK